MSERLIYFADTTVPTYMTPGIKEKLPKEIVDLLLTMAFNRGRKFLDTGDEQLRAAYFQFFDISVTRKKLIIRHMQEQPDIDKTLEIDISNNSYAQRFIVKKMKESTMRVYLIEDWNGTPKEIATREDHYITMLLPDEY